MTSSDRHASHNSPYRTGQHQPLPQSRHAPLTSIATNAGESRTDLSSSYGPDTADSSDGDFLRPPGTQNARGPYSPGMRSTMQRTQLNEITGLATFSTGEIQMQNFNEGLPPPPPVSHSWKRIDRWVEDNYEELFDNLSGACTQNDINELEHELDCTLPMEVRESLQVHDGQERGGLPTGIIFGCMLLDCEEIVQEWKNWRKVNDDYLTQQTTYDTPQLPMKAFGPVASSSATPSPPAQKASNPMWRADLQARQESQPTNAIQKAYAHPAWIPLARDWGGNNIAVDLAPGPAGKWGQIIIIGRDYDCKFVIARSWAAFLATVADDLSTNKVFVNEDTNELKLREFKQQGVEPAYLDILRWRADQKYGRKMQRRKSGPNNALHINANVAGNVNRGSPYSSPTAADVDRGRSPQRFPAKTLSASSPRANVSSPLARVAEEAPSAIKMHRNLGPSKEAIIEEKLVATETPRESEDLETRLIINGAALNNPMETGVSKENQRPLSTSGLRLKNMEVSGEMR